MFEQHTVSIPASSMSTAKPTTSLWSSSDEARYCSSSEAGCVVFCPVCVSCKAEILASTSSTATLHVPRDYQQLVALVIIHVTNTTWSCVSSWTHILTVQGTATLARDGGTVAFVSTATVAARCLCAEYSCLR